MQTKLTSETKDISFDFISALRSGETISSAEVSVVLASGTGPAPTDLLVGAPTVDGLIVYQTVTGGVAGNIYMLKFSVTTSTDRELIKQVTVAVLSNNPF